MFELLVLVFFIGNLLIEDSSIPNFFQNFVKVGTIMRYQDYKYVKSQVIYFKLLNYCNIILAEESFPICTKFIYCLFAIF